MVLGKNLLFAKSGIRKIRPDNLELSQVQDNIGNTLETVLGHLQNQQNGYQQAIFAPLLVRLNPNVPDASVQVPALFIRGRADGAFVPNQPTIVFGEPSRLNAQGSYSQQLDSCLFSYGQIVAFGSTQTTDGFVIIPRVSGPAFRIAPNNTYTSFIINFDGTVGASNTVSAPSFNSVAGFKSWLTGMFYWNTNYPGGLLPLVINVTNGSVASTTPWGQPMTRSGSVVGVSAYHTGQSNVTCAIYLYRNGAQTYAGNITNGGQSGQVAFPKGTFPFVAGDVLSARIGYDRAGLNVCTQVAIEVEEVA